MKKSHSALVVVVVTAAIFAAWQLGRALVSPRSARKADDLVNRVWLDRMPADSRDKITYVVFVDHPHAQFGATGLASWWEHELDVFMWQLEGNKMRVLFPHNQMRARVRVETWRCAGEAPPPFELCLRITDLEYHDWIIVHSREDWVIDAIDTIGSAARLASREPSLAGVLRGFAGVAPGPAADLEGSENWIVTTFGLL